MAQPATVQEEKISIRAFARLMGVRDTTVHKAIKAGKIVKGVSVGTDGKNDGIYPNIAKAEWAEAWDETFSERSPTLAKNLATAPPSASPTPQHQAADADAAQDHSLASAKRMTAVLRAKQLQLQIQQFQGTLVEKSEVDKALFAAGQEIKSTMLALPDRVIDDIMAQKTRGAAYQILFDAIVEALTAVSDALTRGSNG